jgi:hypothetical protein
VSVGVSDGIGESKVVSANANWGGLIWLYEVPIICLSGSYSDSLEEGRAYDAEVEDLRLVGRGWEWSYDGKLETWLQTCGGPGLVGRRGQIL